MEQQSNQPPPIIESEHWNLTTRKLTRIDGLILAVLCILTIGIASYDFYSQKEVEERCLTDCNNHWVKEFETKCAGPWGNKDMIRPLIYDYNVSNPTKK